MALIFESGDQTVLPADPKHISVYSEKYRIFTSVRAKVKRVALPEQPRYSSEMLERVAQFEL
jgi:hypothetical protein